MSHATQEALPGALQARAGLRVDVVKLPPSPFTGPLVSRHRCGRPVTPRTTDLPNARSQPYLIFVDTLFVLNGSQVCVMLSKCGHRM